MVVVVCNTSAGIDLLSLQVVGHSCKYVYCYHVCDLVHTHKNMFNNEFVRFIIVYNINDFGMCVSTDTIFLRLWPCNLLL